MKFLSSLLVLVAAFALYGCEKCSTCTLELYDVSCEYEGFFGPTSFEGEGLTLEEVEDYEASCDVWEGDFEKTSADDSREECGKKKDVEEEVEDLEKKDWKCSDLE